MSAGAPPRVAAGRVVVTGVGLVSALGDSAPALASALGAGRSAAAPAESFPLDGLSCRRAAEVREFDAATYLGPRNLRPLDRTARLAGSAAQLALDASGWSEERRAAQEVGLVLGTMFGSVRTIAEFDRRALVAGPNYARPMDFANTVINAAAGQTAILHGLRGVNSTISGGIVSGLQALSYAVDAVRGGAAPAVLAGGADELCYESFFGFYRAGLIAGSRNGCGPRAVPFDADRNGFLPGEGAALLMLEDAEAARRRGATVIAEVLGHGSGFAPRLERERGRARAVAAAVRGALADADLDPSAIDAISASASGSVAGDRAEVDGLAAAFGLRVPPTMAIKSMLGEPLGAGGALQAVALIEAMRSGQLPGILGLERLDTGGNGSADAVAAMLSADNRTVAIAHGLVTGIGLDGNASALVLAAPAEVAT